MSAGGMRSPIQRGVRFQGLRVSFIAAMASGLALMGAMHPPSAQAKGTRGQRVSARTAAKHRSPAVEYRPGTAKRPDKLRLPPGEESPVLDVVAELLGRPYRFGSDRGAFDCSGLVRWVFAKLGVDLPRSAREQFTTGERVDRQDLETGDLVFFREPGGRYATHVGIYAGAGKFIHAARRAGRVQVDSLKAKYFARRYIGARRL